MMQVCMGAMMMCSFGAAPSSLIAIGTVITNVPAANIMDYAPFVNIPPFAMCSSLANPAVASATSAALGVLTPMPCIPAVAAPWAPGKATVMLRNMPTLDSGSKAICSFGGTIQITSPGQTKASL